MHPEFAKSTKVTRDSNNKGKGRHRGPPLAPLVSHHTGISEPDSANDSDESSAEGGDDDDNGEDNNNDDDDDDADDSSSDEDVILSNFNLMSSSIYVALTNMDIKKISNNELCLISLRAKATKNKRNYDSERFHRINRFRRTKLSVSIEGIVVYDSSSGIHIIRDSKLLIPGSIRRIPESKRFKVQGTFENAHVLRNA